MSDARRFLIPLVALLVPFGALAQQLPSPLLTNTQDGGSRPIPDPTLLTTQAQERAISALRELLDARAKGLADENAWQTKEFDSSVARIVLRLDRIPEMIETRTIELQRLMEEKFKGVDQQFAGRDVALAAALLAQKTSVDEQNKANAASSAKAEGATTKQIDGIQSIIFANSKATDDKIDGVKSLLATQARSIDDKINDLRTSLADLRTAQGINNTALVSRSAGQSDAWAGADLPD
jgi:hypothetical protein